MAMITIRGQKVSEGVAIGPTTVFTSREISVREAHIDSAKVEAEVKKFRRAVKRSETDIRALRDQQGDHQEVARIVEISLDLLRDPHLFESIEQRIREHLETAPFAVNTVMAQTARMLESMDNPTFSSKVADVIDLEHRLLNHLLGGRLNPVQKLSRKLIVVADDISPTQAATLDRDRILGFATERGSWASHTAILARALGIPAVVGVPDITRLSVYGASIIIDGDEGLVIVDPDQETLARYRARRRRLKRKLAGSASQMRRLEAVTRDGQPCVLQGNIETRDDVSLVQDFGGAGVGLFRTEFLYLGREEPPDEEMQLQEYSEAAASLDGEVLTVRTMDFGGDKFDRRQNQSGEANPFMGERAIRVSLKHEDFFRVQLKAILRAGLSGRVQIMFPMIMDVGEFRQALAVVETARGELRKAGVPFDETMKIGAMVELPSTALNMRRLAAVADFFSIGTNDLTQHLLGVDRTNHRVAHLYAGHHPSVITLIAEIVRCARNAGKPLGVCGEMAGDPRMTPLLLGVGVRHLSMTPRQIPKVKKRLRGLYLARCVDLAERVIEADDAAEAERLLSDFD